MIDWTKTVTVADKLEQKREAKRSQINADFTTAMATLKAGYPKDERDTWHEQIREREGLASGKATPMLSGIAFETGQTVQVVADNVQQNQLAFAEHAGTAVGTRKRRIAALEAATTEAEIDVV